LEDGVTLREREEKKNVMGSASGKFGRGVLYSAYEGGEKNSRGRMPPRLRGSYFKRCESRKGNELGEGALQSIAVGEN